MLNRSILLSCCLITAVYTSCLSEGTPGSQGSEGLSGPTRAQGPEGQLGSTEAQGPEEVSGPTGAQRAMGAMGSVAPTGSTGAMGHRDLAGPRNATYFARQTATVTAVFPGGTVTPGYATNWIDIPGAAVTFSANAGQSVIVQGAGSIKFNAEYGWCAMRYLLDGTPFIGSHPTAGDLVIFPANSSADPLIGVSVLNETTVATTGVHTLKAQIISQSTPNCILLQSSGIFFRFVATVQ